VIPFDIKAAMLAKYAQKVVVIHYPIALFFASIAFDLFSRWKGKRALARGANFNPIWAASLRMTRIISTHSPRSVIKGVRNENLPWRTRHA
jgi:hypothetical protein